MKESLHFARHKKTIHMIKRHEEFRLVVKSSLHVPDTLIAKIPLADLSFVSLSNKKTKLKSIEFSLNHSTRIESLLVDKEKKEITLEFNENKEVLSFTSKEWNEILSFIH